MEMSITFSYNLVIIIHIQLIVQISLLKEKEEQ